MARDISEGIISGLKNYSGFRQQNQDNALNALKMQSELAQLEEKKAAREMLSRAIMGGGGAGGGSPMMKSFKVGDQEFVNPAYADYELGQKRREEEMKREFKLTDPLSDTAAGRLEGAKQVLEQAQKIRSLATPEAFNKMKGGVSKIRMGQATGITQPGSIRGAIANTMTGGLAKLPFQTSDDEKSFELGVNLIAENLLRARTGAAAPEAEVKREAARMMTSDDSLDSFLNRLGTSETYAQGIGESLRPGSMRSLAPQPRSLVSNQGNEENAIYANNGKQRIKSTDGGNTWQAA